MTKPKGVGRPSSFTPEIADAICEWIAEGQSLASFCREKGVGYSTVMRWLSENATFQENYARAHEDAGDADADKISDVAQRCLAGEFDPQAARVAIDALKWTAGKRKPKKYGDRLQLANDEKSPLTPVEFDPQARAKAIAQVLLPMLAKAKAE